LVATLVLVPVAIIVGADFSSVNGNDWWLIAAQVVVPGLIGHTLITWATRYLDITLVSLINLLSPAISMAGAWIIYSQSMQTLQVVGAIVMLIAVGVVVRTRNSNVQPVAEAITAE
jgi:drug/metabolite transporter (DMT)-like permease